MDLAIKQLLLPLASSPPSPSIKAILLQGTTPKAFSSGGDVKWMTTTGRQQMGIHKVAVKVFSAEYSLICLIASLPLPLVSLIDGITMGFGIGLSAHGTFRVATERTLLAMPENAIGLFPDVGFAKIAAHTPLKGAAGLYFALTGRRVSTPADALYLGIATHFVPSNRLPELKEALLSLQLHSSSDPTAEIRSLLDSFSEPVDQKQSALFQLEPLVRRCFLEPAKIADVIKELKDVAASENAEDASWASTTLATLLKLCPFSLALTYRHFRAVADAAHSTSSKSDQPLSTIEGVMKLEYRLAVRTTARGDFVEGVRAVLVDKDQNPRWQPQTLEEVDFEEVEATFSEFIREKDELTL